MSVIGEPSFASWATQRASGYGGNLLLFFFNTVLIKKYCFLGNLTVVDKVPPDMLYLVDAHWYQYPPLNPLWHGILGFMIGVLGFVSVIGNGMVS